jgi:hypothetical protein
MPLVADPQGDYVIIGPRTVSSQSRAVHINSTVDRGQIEAQVRLGRRFHSHFSDCPNAAEHRKEK